MLREHRWSTQATITQIASLIRKNKKYFANGGGDIETFLTKVKISHSKRVFTKSPDQKFKILLTDLEQGLELVKKNTSLPGDDNSSELWGLYI